MLVWNLPKLAVRVRVEPQLLARLQEVGLLSKEAEQRLKDTSIARLPYRLFQEIDDLYRDSAVASLVEVLIETGNTEAARVLCPSQVTAAQKKDGCAFSSNRSPASLKEPTHKDKEKFKVTLASMSDIFTGENIYRLDPGRFRGQALVISFEEFQDSDKWTPRAGSKTDVTNLSHVFGQLGLKVAVERNLSRASFLQVLINFADSDDHGSMMVLVVLSHGEQGNAIVCQDGKTVNVDTDTDKMSIIRSV